MEKAIAAGVNIIHINAELRVAWRRRGLEAGLAGQPDEVVPYKILPSAVESVKQVVRSRLQLFNPVLLTARASKGLLAAFLVHTYRLRLDDAGV